MDQFGKNGAVARAARSLSRLGVVAVPALAVMVPASAAAPAADDAVVLEEVVVTAERREMNLQDTPLSILAVTGEGLEAKGVDDLMDLADFTPNLSIKAGRTGGNNAPVFSIRGIGGGGGATGERGVALYIDGIYVPRTSGSVFKVFDIDRAEVLRGPQGTLFGRNSEGGAIRLFTKQPTSEFEAYVRGTVGNFSHKDVSGMVNIPVTDKFALRAQVASLDIDGFVTRGTQELGGTNAKLARLQGAYDFTDDVKLTLGGLYSYSKGTGSPQDIVSFELFNLNFQGNNADWLRDALVLAGQPPLEAMNDRRVLLDDYTMPSFCFLDDFDPDWDEACALKDNNRYRQVDANLQWAISDTVQFASITGAANLNSNSLSDAVLLGFNSAQTRIESKSLYQEFQLNAALFGGRVDAVTGLNYFHEKSDSDGTSYARRGTSTYPTAAQITAAANAGNANTAVGSPNGNRGEAFLRIGNGTDTQQTGKSWGSFTSLTWHITDQLNLTGGVRFGYDRKDITATRIPGVPIAGVPADFVPVPGTTSTTVNADDNWKSTDWRGTLDYHFNDDIMIYATASEAHKAGAFPAFTFISCTAAAGQPLVAGSPTCPTGAQQSPLYSSIPPESVTNLEMGLRMTLADGRLRLNPTGYYMDWTNRQTTVRLPCPGGVSDECPTGSNVFLRNTGDIDLYGAEIDMQYAVTNNLTIDGAFGSTGYNIHDVVANGGPNLFPPQATPTWNLGATYNLRGTSLGNFLFNMNYSFTSSQETYPESTDPALLSDGSYKMPSYSVVNSRIQWSSPSRAISVTAYANNLLDNNYENFATKFGGGFWDAFNSQTGIQAGLGTLAPGVGAPLRNMVSVTRSRPREYGLTLQYNF